MKYTIGADPELFLMRDGGFLNAFDGYEMGVIKGTKNKPEPTDYGAVQVDGMAVEINTLPTDDPVKFSGYIQQGIQDVHNRYNSTSCFDSYRTFDMDYLELQHPEAVELGCDPDFNAWEKGKPNPMPNMFQPLRTAGGHVHVGWDVTKGSHKEDAMSLVKELDCSLGAWSLLLDPKGGTRRELYGKAGSFRLKPYGLEYRVLSNFWIFNPDTRYELARRTFRTLELWEQGVSLLEHTSIPVRKAIDTGNVEDCARIEIQLGPLLETRL